MIFLPEIVTAVNSAIKERLTPYPTARIEGLTYPVTYNREDNSTITVPAVLMAKDARLLVNDDRFPFTLYHRALTANNDVTTNNSYGDGYPRDVLASAEIELIVIGFRDRIKVAPEQIAAVIGDSIPAQMTVQEGKLNIPSIRVNWTSIQYDQRSTWNQQFQGLTYGLSINEFMVSLRYRITVSYMQGCLINCEC